MTQQNNFSMTSVTSDHLCNTIGLLVPPALSHPRESVSTVNVKKKVFPMNFFDFSFLICFHKAGNAPILAS